MPPYPYSRRDFLANASGAALVALASDSLAAEATPETPATTALASAFTTAHEPKPLPFNPAKLDGISEKLIRSHWENNYSGAVKALNTVKKRLVVALEDADTPPFLYNDLKREHLTRTGSVVLHELYFHNLGGSGKAGETLKKALAEAFGSYDAWEKEFRRIGAGLGGGSGWVVLGHNLHTGLLENYWLADHLHSPAATLPILVMDMYEHAYQMDYGAAATQYVDAFFRNIQWDVAAVRLEKALKIQSL
ncbi:MAG: Fe-Mn family superoxide dismutase [Methylovulum sp.]|uniref:superoxide dismutase n=1 Tax=Methylovulum sp. TaxID=1916980 RepID=UPI00260920CA|nr:Fe-Mn family superoxide dismutase [Methylovulum sp.]MDD2724376.1 Fe-Mn family superoxide dismutase [Methylovulum sp.]MDD5124204.1 Fe-Mn family superoxide dismutase [Methylovulum sp.]